MNLSIILVTWNSEDDIIECLTSIINGLPKEDSFKYETVIVDNASSDNTVQVIENFIKVFGFKIKFIKNQYNLGFTKACNQAIHSSTGEFILILNPDTEVIGDALIKLYDFLKNNKDSGVVAPQLISLYGDIHYSCRTFPKYRDMFFELFFLSTLFPKNRFFSRWKMRYFSHNEMREVEQPMGAALLLNRSILEKVGGMDERFIMFFNDVDFCKRIHDAGYKLYFYPESKFRHVQGTSVYKDRSAMILHWNNDCLNYFRKHNFNIILYPLLWAGLRISGVIRYILAKLKII